MTNDEYLKKGYDCMSRDDIRSAVEYFQAVLDSDPENKEAKMCLYMAYNRQGKPQYAEKYHDGKVPVVNAPYSYTPYSSKDTSYIEWHKKQVIKKWSSIFITALGPDKDDCIDDTDVISYQLILSRLKQRNISKNKSAYYYLARPLYCKDKSMELPLFTGDLETEKTQSSGRKLKLSEMFRSPLIVHPKKYTGEDYYSSESFFRPPLLFTSFYGDNLLEKIEYEYYALWRDYYLGLWQWEQWKPHSTMEEIIGIKHLIMGIDEEMHEIASEYNENSEAKMFFTKILSVSSFENDNEKATFVRVPDIKLLELTDDVIEMLHIEPFSTKKGRYGDYFVCIMFYYNEDGEKCASAVFGPYEGYLVQPGDFLNIPVDTPQSHKNKHIHDGACVIE